MLYGAECPPVGGDTLFSNQYLAWEALSDEMRQRLGDKKAVNSAAKSYNGHSGSDEVKDHSAMPLISIEEEEESLPLLHELWRHAITPEFTLRFCWQAGTLALWDNRCAMHYVHNDYTGHRRVMHRIVIEGERPV